MIYWACSTLRKFERQCSVRFILSTAQNFAGSARRWLAFLQVRTALGAEDV